MGGFSTVFCAFCKEHLHGCGEVANEVSHEENAEHEDLKFVRELTIDEYEIDCLRKLHDLTKDDEWKKQCHGLTPMNLGRIRACNVHFVSHAKGTEGVETSHLIPCLEYHKNGIVKSKEMKFL